MFRQSYLGTSVGRMNIAGKSPHHFSSKPLAIQSQPMTGEHSQQNQTLNQVLGWLHLWFGVACDQSCSHAVWFEFSQGPETPLVQALLKEKSGTSFPPDCSVCVCVSVSKAALLCLLVTKNDELQKYPFGVSHSVQQEGSRKPL